MKDKKNIYVIYVDIDDGYDKFTDPISYHRTEKGAKDRSKILNKLLRKKDKKKLVKYIEFDIEDIHSIGYYKIETEE